MNEYRQGASFKKTGKCKMQSIDLEEDERAEDIEEYQKILSSFADANFSYDTIAADLLKQHNISVISNKLHPFDDNHYQKDKTFFSIVSTQFYGLEYTYQVYLGPFKLRILVLNMHREADSGDPNNRRQELGAGSFGSVFQVKLNHKTYAVKRIPFLHKLQPQQGYDFEESKGEQLQLKKCLKQFCYYKIFSLLNIGPKIVNTGYDLICFNNCVEFKMELCEPITNDFQYMQKGLDLQECEKTLMKKLMMMHSMRIVHRDIKPENILYSPTQREMVFGDFGMTMLLQEGYKSTTLTRFAGTPNFCSPSMARLLNGGKGYVNLYLNDLHSIKQTLKQFQGNFVSYTSQISSNSMSYNQQQSFYGGSVSFSMGSQQAYSDVGVSDQSYNTPTVNSIASQSTTTKILAPKQNAFIINHFASEITYLVCRAKEKEVEVSSQFVKSIVDKCYDEHDLSQIQYSLRLELYSLFQFTVKKPQPDNLIKEWKFASRHYGPQSKTTLSLLQNVGKSGSQNYTEQIIKIKQIIGRHSRAVDQLIIEMELLKNMNPNRTALLDVLYSLIETSVKYFPIDNASKKHVGAIAKNYIYCSSLFLDSFEQSNYMAALVNAYFKFPFKSDHSQFSQMIVRCTYMSLKTNNEVSYQDSFRYIYICFADTYQLSFDTNQPIIIQQIEDLIKILGQMNQKQKFDFGILLSKLCNYKDYKFKLFDVNKYRQVALKIADEYIGLVSGNFYQLFYAKRLKAWILNQMEKQQENANEYKELLEMLQIQSKISNKNLNNAKLSILCSWGEVLMKREHVEQCEQVFLKAQTLIDESGGYLLHQAGSYEVLKNLALISLVNKNYDKSLSQLMVLRDFLSKGDIEKQNYKELSLSCYIINILLAKGLTSQKDRQFMIENIQSRLENLFYECSKSNTYMTYYYKWYPNFVSIVIQQFSEKDLQYLHEQIRKAFNRNKPARRILHYQYACCNFDLGKLYILQKEYIKGSKCLWNFLKSRLQRVHPLKFDQFEVDVALIYTNTLLECKFYRQAIRFLKNIIKYIPLNESDIKLKLVKRLCKAMEKVAHPQYELYYQLSKNNYRKIKQGSFTSAIQKVSNSQQKILMLERQMKKVFFVEVRRGRQSRDADFWDSL